MAFALPRPWLTTGFVVGGASDNWPGSLLLTRVAVVGYLASSGSENSRKNCTSIQFLVRLVAVEPALSGYLIIFIFHRVGVGGGCS